MLVRDDVRITLNGKEYVLRNTLHVRKQIAITFGGIRPMMLSVQQLDEWRMAQAIAIAAGIKKVDPVFEDLIESGAIAAAEGLGEYVTSLFDTGQSGDDSEGDPGNVPMSAVN